MITLLIIGSYYILKSKFNIILQRGLEIAELKEEDMPKI